MHIAYLGRDLCMARRLGFWEVDDQAQDPRETGTCAAVRDLDPRDAPESSDPFPARPGRLARPRYRRVHHG